MPTVNSLGKIEYKGGEMLPAVGTEAYKQAQSGTIPTISNDAATFIKNSTGTIEAARLGSTPLATVPTPVNSNKAQTNLAVQTTAIGEGILQGAEQQTQPETTANKRQGVLDSILSGIQALRGRGDRTAELNKEEGVFEKKQLATKLEGEYISKQRAYDKQIEESRKNKKGMLASAVESEISTLERQKNSELADIAIQYKIAGGAYNDAVEIVNAKIAAEFEPLQNEIDSLTNLYQLYSDDLTESEKIRAQAVIQEKQAELDFKRQIARDAQLHKYDLERIAYQESFGDTGDVGIIHPIIDPETGNTDPTGYLATVINSSGAKDNVNLQNVLGVVSSLQDLAQSNIEGKFKGASPLPRLTPGVLKSQEQVSNKAYIEAINLKVQQWASGASLTKKQTKQVNKITPKKGDSDNEIKRKINALTNFMLNQASGTLASQGIHISPGSVDYFGNKLSMDEIADMDAVLNQ